ncbi:sterol desaturase family protein [Altericista sp. CCNU0014]|uniref:sterol desaturase family protein n=1 Tax=Altericista sp. CCNU0014 TaxID=3082949 RepID=UPI00384DEB85
MQSQIQYFLAILAISYTVLLGIYFLFGKIITFWNRHLGCSKKIQSKTSSEVEIKRDIVQSVKSLFFIALMLAGGIFCQRIGLTLRPTHLTPLNSLLWFLVSMFIFDTWFYWGHRLIHTKVLYRQIHAWHHRSITPSVWSNNSDTLLDDLILQSYFFFAPFFLPIPAAILIAHKIYDQITGMIGHSGYEYSAGPLSRFPFLLLGVTFHDQHHESFNYNYATHFSLWDRLMKTIHPAYDRRILDFEKSPVDLLEIEPTNES